ncbi:ABC-three component system middle component 5 [Pseudomonas sp. R4-35-07]|uniref:ABC-three component system middle component 5 n=1 Tax=Pseudomonas sp. R4-35-07 TaxID=658643 RepID=UPI000F566040|nr:ABC-three component system middle component 5 [Pseudomonas sp. R4-35-07]
MLIYHPAYDANHCLYRLLAILQATTEFSLTWDQLRILDYYYLFPSQLKNIKPWPASIKEFKVQLKSIPEQFEDINNPARVLYDLQVFQKTAALELIAKGIISKFEFESGLIKIDTGLLPIGYLELLDSDLFLRGDAFEIITKALPKVEFNGESGLKKRSGLMEYIYDVK